MPDTLTIRISDDQRRRLNKVAAAERRSMGFLVRDALEDYLTSREIAVGESLLEDSIKEEANR